MALNILEEEEAPVISTKVLPVLVLIHPNHSSPAADVARTMEVRDVQPLVGHADTARSEDTSYQSVERSSPETEEPEKWKKQTNCSTSEL